MTGGLTLKCQVRRDGLTMIKLASRKNLALAVETLFPTAQLPSITATLDRAVSIPPRNDQKIRFQSSHLSLTNLQVQSSPMQA